MTQHLFKEIQKLKEMIVGLSTLVEERVYLAVRAVVDSDRVAAEKVINGDVDVDRTEVEVEEECLKILALHQPVAGDLRFIVAVMKLNNDLERIADLAVGVAHGSKTVMTSQNTTLKGLVSELGAKAKVMLKRSLDALVQIDAEEARRVLLLDDEIDQINRTIKGETVRAIKKDPDSTEQLLVFRTISRNMERICDHATNIAEDVIYLAEGEIVRHQKLDS